MSIDSIDDVTELSAIERDALAEIANIGAGRAAANLRQMIGQEVLLSVPGVGIVSRRAASELVERDGVSKLVSVQQSFEGPFAGRALLIFPESQSLELVQSMLGDARPEDVTELQQEALAETGNVILNGCLATIANVLRKTMRMSLPAVFRGDGVTLFEAGRENGNLVLLLYIDFAIRNRDIGGFIALLMDPPSILALKKIVRDLIDGIRRDPACNDV